jgi:Family of unknown function (DUF5677)
VASGVCLAVREGRRPSPKIRGVFCEPQLVPANPNHWPRFAVKQLSVARCQYNLHMTDQAQVVFGVSDEAGKFEQRHPLWRKRFENLVGAINVAFTRGQTMSDPADKLVYFYGRMCAEDFMEVLLVCGNGYGEAGLKLLRSLYEHTVTLHYLHEHTDEIDAFMDFHHVQQYKLMRNILDTVGKDALQPDTVAKVEERYAKVKNDFLVTDCEKCGTKRPNHAWSKLDFVSMAKKAGSIGRLIVPGYFVPLRHAHPTFGGLSDRLEIVEDRMQLRHESKPEVADQALMTAHNCLLKVLDLQNERFKIDGLKEQLQTCFQDFVDIWFPNSEQAMHAEGSSE